MYIDGIDSEGDELEKRITNICKNIFKFLYILNYDEFCDVRDEHNEIENLYIQ